MIIISTNFESYEYTEPMRIHRYRLPESMIIDNLKFKLSMCILTMWQGCTYRAFNVLTCTYMWAWSART